MARFVFQKNHLAKAGTPKPVAFDPELHPELRRWETSVCGMHGVSKERLWHLGRTIRTDKKPAIAAIELTVASVDAARLRCEALPDAFDEHGVILGWDDDKDRRLAAQQALVAAHLAVLRPPLNEGH